MTMKVLTKIEVQVCVCYVACIYPWERKRKWRDNSFIWVGLSFLPLISFLEKYPCLSAPALLHYICFILCLHQVLRDTLCSVCVPVFQPLSIVKAVQNLCCQLAERFFSFAACVSMIFPAAPRPACVAWQWQLKWYVLYSAVICIIGTVEGSAQCQCFWCRSDKTVVSCWRLTDLELYQQMWIHLICLFRESCSCIWTSI